MHPFLEETISQHIFEHAGSYDLCSTFSEMFPEPKIIAGAVM